MTKHALSSARSLIDSDATYLVTGGAGFIGSQLAEVLLSAGATVRILDDFSFGSDANVQAAIDGARAAGVDDAVDRIQVLRASVTDPDACREACDGVRYVFHEAAIASVPRSVKAPIPTHDADCTGTLNMLIAAVSAGVDRFIYAGSSSAYGDTPTLPKTESMRPLPLSPYAVAKLAGEQYCGAWASSYGLHTTTLRYFNIFGPRQDPGSMYSGVIAVFATAALEGRTPTIYGDGGQTRDFTFIENVIDANLRAAHAAGPECAGKVYNVGCGDRISVNDLWDEIRRAAGVTGIEAEYGPTREGDVRDSLADLQDTRADLGYEVVVPFDAGIAATVDWYRDNM
jgi:nucleoside-diphosphate-sugar epimerase